MTSALDALADPRASAALPAMKPVIVLTTVGERDDAGGLASALVERRLAACVNILSPMRSIYRWKGRVTDDQEQILLIKTVDVRIDSVRSFFVENHPYELPEFIVLDLGGISDDYRDWLIESSTQPIE
jgi:periplasmic divalent cation tolerance protein